MKVVEPLKPCGAQSFLEYGAAYIPHLGDKTFCFLDMFITHMLLKICKCLALYSRASQQYIKHLENHFSTAQCNHLDVSIIISYFLLPHVMNPKVRMALPT